MGPECSSCDERIQNKGPAAEFARRQLAARKQKDRRQKRPEESGLEPRFEEPNSARLDLRRFRSSTKIAELKKETKPFPALPAEEGEEEEAPEPYEDDQDKPDYRGGPDDDKSPGAAAIAAVAANS